MQYILYETAIQQGNSIAKRRTITVIASPFSEPQSPSIDAYIAFQNLILSKNVQKGKLNFEFTKFHFYRKVQLDATHHGCIRIII